MVDAGKITPGIPQNVQFPDVKKKEDEPGTTPQMPVVNVGDGLKPGEKVTVTIDGKQVIEIKKEGKTGWQQFEETTKKAMKGALVTGMEVLKNDPSFAFREAVMVSKGSVMKVVPETLKELGDKGVYPTIRVGLLAIDLMKLYKTMKEPGTPIIDKIVDIGHIVTDVAGVVAVAVPFLPGPIPGAVYLSAAAIVGDIISGGWHAIRYVIRKGEEAKKSLEQKPDVSPPATPSQNAPKVIKEEG